MFGNRNCVWGLYFRRIVNNFLLVSFVGIVFYCVLVRGYFEKIIDVVVWKL